MAQEIDRREHSLDEQLERAGATRDAYLSSRGLSGDDLDAEFAVDARKFVKAGFVLDQIARQEDLGIEQEELNAYLVEQAYRLGVPPDRLAKEIVDRGQLGVAVTEVLRSKALDVLAGRAAITDEAGSKVDLKAIMAEAEAEAEEGAAEEGAAEEGAAEEGAAEEGAGEPAAGEAGTVEAATGEAGPAGAGAEQAGGDEPAG